MKRLSNHLFLTLVALLGLMVLPQLLSSCISDAVTTSSSDVLSFSRDTVSFDTVFTDLGTPTARLIVRNPAKKGIVISSIRFKNPDGNFRMNVDGVSGSEFKDVEIRAKDSIFVFIECYIPENSTKEPSLVEDELQFVTNGVTQNVLLEAWGQNVRRLRGHIFDSDARLDADMPYVVFDSLIVGPKATLTVDPDVQLLFHDKAYMRVYGKLEAVGEPGKMIDMRGDRLDNVLTDTPYDIMAGQWNGLSMAPESFDNRLEYVNMRSTVYGLMLDSCAVTDRTKLTVINSWLHNSQGSVLTATHSKVEAFGSVFSESQMAVIYLTGGEYAFNQCTFANNYLFSAILEPIVTLNGLTEEDSFGLPPMKGEFTNSIIYGIPDDINAADLTGTQVFFHYTSFKAAGSDDDNFLNCLWDTDPLFLTNRPEYYFNYRLQADSPVKAAGDPALVNPAAAIDMDGINRLQFGNPSLGAYQSTE